MPLHVSVSPAFRKNAIRSILSIVLFAVVFIFLILLALGFALACGYFGIALILASPSFITLLVGGGLVAMGVLVAYSLLKFVGARYTPDRSGLIEIKREKQPELFRFIDELTAEVDTKAPRRVYLSADVNAGVFYDSSFRSMFMPVDKNLQVGMGLVNAVTVKEFKAILAHEFGHFSQRSMKVGSYVYHVNQALYNLLNDTEGYQGLVQGIARTHWIMALFARMANKIVQGIHWVLARMYKVVNIRYSALSREMEFHADEVAAQVAGSQPMIDSLLRLGFADQAYSDLIQFYNDRIPKAIVTRNLYTQHLELMAFWARENKLAMRDGIPLVSKEEFARYRKSKLVVANQWASHPSTEERVARLEKLAIPDARQPDCPAAALFRDYETLQSGVTEFLFGTVNYEKDTVELDCKAFIHEYSEVYQSNSFDQCYNGYYDHKNIEPFDLDIPVEDSISGSTGTDMLFGTAMVDSVYTLNAMRQDLADIRQISEGNTSISTFDYEGTKYQASEVAGLIARIENEMAGLQEKLTQHDRLIYAYYRRLAMGKGIEDELRRHYQSMFDADRDWERQINLYQELRTAMQFMYETTPLETIEAKLGSMKDSEEMLKTEIRALVDQDGQIGFLSEEMKRAFDTFLKKERVYFIKPDYLENEVNELSASIDHYQQALSARYFRLKKILLDFQAGLDRSPLDVLSSPQSPLA